MVMALLFFSLCFIGGRIGAPGTTLFRVASLTIPSGPFLLVYALIWFSVLGMFLLFPRMRNIKSSFVLILLMSVIARIAWLSHPASDDVNRYLWEGFLITKGISPYHHAPMDPQLSALTQGFVFFKNINHPDISAAYPPLLLYVFSILGRIWQDPMMIKIAMGILDLVAAMLLMAYLQIRGRDVRWALLYALNPLVLISFAGQGHGDALQAVFLLAALCLYERKQSLLMFVCLGLAVQSKGVSILVVPFFITKENRRFIPFFLISAMVFWLPFMDEGTHGLWQGLVTFGSHYTFNGPFQSLLRVMGLGAEGARMVCTLLLGVTFMAGIVLFRSGGIKNTEHDPVPGSFWVLGALIILSPTVHAWYLCWLLPLAVIVQRRSWLLLSLSIGFYYVVSFMDIHYEQWRLPAWAMVFEWLPFGLVFLIEMYFFLIRCPRSWENKPVVTVSVVVPAMNEEKGIANCVSRIRDDKAVLEVIVVDGGSTDKTVEQALRAGAHVIVHNRAPENGGGRGGQIHRGIEGASGDVVAVVHADTRMEPGAFSEMVAFLSRQPHMVGGALGSVFDQVSLRMKFIEFLNHLRAVVFTISFGDQIQFFRRRPVADQDLYPAIPLMEDVEFSLRLSRLGHIGYLFGGSQVSSRRWKKEGFNNALTVLLYFSTYLMQRIWKTPDTVSMYRRYYDK